MAYTVKNASELSGVTVRTLRWYDEIGLLKPAYYGENNYRYYEEEQLLKLQQILFFRGLGFRLDDIQRILSSSDFDQSKTLLDHRKSLKQRLNQTEQLIKTIDSTLEHLRGNQVMKHEDLYQGFKDWSADKGAESFFIGRYDHPERCEDPNEKIVLTNVIENDRSENWSQDDWEQHQKKGNDILNEVADCLRQKIEPKSPQVQAAIKKHCEYGSQFHSMSRAVYVALSELYTYKKEYRDQLDPFHSELHDYISRAMKIYAYNDLD